MAAAAEGQEEAKTEAEMRAEQDARRKFLWERPRVRMYYVHFVRPPSLPSFPPLLHPLDSSFCSSRFFVNSIRVFSLCSTI